MAAPPIHRSILQITRPRAIDYVQIRLIRYERLSNKRITRLQSEIELADDDYKSRVINRNPRNLEQLSFEKKPAGFWLDKAPPAHWNKVQFEQKDRHLTAYIEHWSGRRIIEASTNEHQLIKYFKSPTSIDSAKLLAQIFARRCIQAGYLSMGTDELEDAGVKKRTFFDCLAQNGLELEESPEIVPRCVTDI